MNLAQVTQIMAYELFVEALAERSRQGAEIGLDSLDSGEEDGSAHDA